MRGIEPVDVADVVRRGAHIVDTRPWELVLERPLPAGEHLPLDKIQQGATPSVAKDTTLVVVCEWGRKSALAGLYLEARGFTDVRHLLGGVAAWSRITNLDGQEPGPDVPSTDATPGTEPR